MSRLSMADVSEKAVTRRRAVASGRIVLGPRAYPLTAERKLPKGDALGLAQVAGILAAKKTPELIPLCHPISLNRVIVDFETVPDAHAVDAYCLAEIAERTGVEMEALTGVSQALLTIWDLAKPVEADLVIENVRLRYKSGGKSGEWQSSEGIDGKIRELLAL